MGAQKWSGHTYIIFALLSFMNISVFALSIAIYIVLLQSAANLAMGIIPLAIPITAFAFGFYNITKHLRDIKAHNKEIENEEKR